MRSKPQQLLTDLALSQHGLVTVSDAQEMGIDAVRLRQMARRGAFERVSRGVYRLAGGPGDRLSPYMAATLWPRGVAGVLSHETALDLHDLCDVNPHRIDITVPRTHHPSRREVPSLYRLHRRDLRADEQTYFEGIAIVTPVRAILDGIGLGLRESLVRQAIETLRERSGLPINDEVSIFAALSDRAAREQ